MKFGAILNRMRYWLWRFDQLVSQISFDFSTCEIENILNELLCSALKLRVISCNRLGNDKVTQQYWRNSTYSAPGYYFENPT